MNLDFFEHVDGKKKGEVLLYAISTCLWCGKTKRLLNELGVDYYYVDIDMIPVEHKPEIREEVKKWKGKAVYPCLVINGRKCIPTYDEARIREELGDA